MAIERVKRVWFLVERDDLARLVERLADQKTTHVVDLSEVAAAENAQGAGVAGTPGPGGGREAEAAHSAEGRVHRLSRALDVLDSLAPPRRSFAQIFVNLPVEMTRAEFERAATDVDVDAVHDEAAALGREHAAAVKRAEEVRVRLARLEAWSEAPLPPAGLSRCRADLGTVPSPMVAHLREAARGSEFIAVEVLSERRGITLVAVACLQCERGPAAELLHTYGFESLGLEAGPGTVADVVARLRGELSEAESEAAEVERRAAEAASNRRALVGALAHWQTEAERRAATGKAYASRRVAALSGYVRTRELPKVENLLRREFPGVSLIAEDPEPGENVPVSLGGSRFFAPAQFLTSMFGLPDYFAFDPSPYILLTFLLFFGLCFGDAVYGLVLTGLGWWLAWKARHDPSLARFFRLLALGGLFSVVVGVLTGSWAGDLFTEKYLGRGNILGRIPSVFDPIEKPVVALGIALAIGVMNQFYAIVLLMYREWRKRNYVGALCDGGLWLMFLPGVLLLVLGMLGPVPGPVTRAATWLVITAGAGLVLTQGRRERSFFGKALTGVVSLYGILGSYGTTSFIGDTLSYCRLFALGLTTFVVAQVCNMFAWYPGVGAFVGVVLAALAVAGHGFNFLVCILGAFVHSLRLIFVEFFTRFYEGGARPFVPLGAPQMIRVLDEN